MLGYDGIDVSEGIDFNKPNASKMWYLFWLIFPRLRLYDLMQKAMSFNGVAIVSVKRSDYRILFWYMSKHDPI